MRRVLGLAVLVLAAGCADIGGYDDGAQYGYGGGYRPAPSYWGSGYAPAPAPYWGGQGYGGQSYGGQSYGGRGYGGRGYEGQRQPAYRPEARPAAPPFRAPQAQQAPRGPMVPGRGGREPRREEQGAD